MSLPDFSPLQESVPARPFETLRFWLPRRLRSSRSSQRCTLLGPLGHLALLVSLLACESSEGGQPAASRGAINPVGSAEEMGAPGDFGGRSDALASDALAPADEAAPADLARPLDAEPLPDLYPLDAAPPRNYPLDDLLRVNHLQALGTHNSYHRRPERSIPPWDYDHPSLEEQLGALGVRQFELDIHEREAGHFEVFHIERLDEETRCSPLAQCLRAMRRWSELNPQHHPILVLLEVKLTRSPPEEVIAALEEILEETWGREQLLTPALLMRDHETVRAGLEEEGWPTLGETRGRLLAILHTRGALREALRAGGLRARRMLPDAYGDLSAHYAAYHSINDPLASGEQIRAVVEAGHLVRTRADANNVEPLALDYARAEAALASGAHWINTDHPYPATAERYGFLIPGGTPSRCNPLVAPPECEAAAIEVGGAQ